MGEAELVWQELQGWWPRLAVALAVLALVAIVFSYRQASTHPWRRVAGLLCKAAVFALLILLLLEPTSVRQQAKKGENHVLLLADGSASLALKQGKEPSAGEALKASWKAGAESGWLHQLEDTFRVQTFSFDGRLHELPEIEQLEFMSERSALGGSLESIAQRFEKQPVAALVVFTDGNATDAAKLESLLAAKPKMPIFPVVLGLDEAPRDVALQSVDVTQTPFEDSPVAVTARVSAQGFGGEEMSLVIRDEKGKTVHAEKHRFGKGETSHNFQARFRPEKMGLSFFTVWALPTAAMKDLDAADKLAASAGELTMANNRRVLAVDRRTGPYRVLYVSGRPNWEYKFMRRALEADNEVKLVALIRMARREPKFQWRGREGEMSNPLFRGFGNAGAEETQRYDQPVMVRLGVADENELPNGQFPKEADELFGAYRAVILDDLEAEFFTQQQMDLLERYVSVRGGSILMLGGQESFRLGGYEHTPLGRMLPVYLDALGAGAVENARFSLTREGWLEPWMRLRNNEGDEENRMAGMPAFFSVNQSTAIKPGASILATVTDDKQKSHPAWIVQRYGSGHVAAVTVADQWRWGMSGREAHADMDKAWRQLLRHLVVDVPDRIELQIPMTSTGSHELVKAQVRVRDKAFRPQDDATVKVEVEEPDGSKLDLSAEPSASEAGLFEASSHASDAGAYRIKATVKDGEDKVVGETTTGWALNPAAEEYASLVPNRPLLDRLAKWSGGRVLSLAELDEWSRKLPDITMPLMETRVEPLWSHWWVLVLLVALLGTEWWMRRRQGWR